MDAVDDGGQCQRNGSASLAAVELTVCFSDVLRHYVGAGEHGIDGVTVEYPAAAAGRIEQRLKLMREPLEHDELHDRGVALERVEGAEHRG